MKRAIIAGVLLVVLGIVLTIVSIPYISENATLGIIGVIGGLLMMLSAIKPLMAARSNQAQHKP
ncbi:hypothetical protein M3D75_15370 [Microbacterium enclense]|uniref:hypothetical protein n=1 Tax=Microbacterium enclense TaxID=993073 RepID=UPI0021A715BD|nr:hypothetical protein [Microbacterium enclense]MCT2087493.1 hypothetical protein [Microbacterium enclense]